MSSSRNAMDELVRKVEAILFVSSEPVKSADIANALGVDVKIVE